MVSHLVNGQNPRADHLSFSGNKRGHDQTGAVTEAQAWLHIQSLEREGNQNRLTISVDRKSNLNSHRELLSNHVPESALCVQGWLKQKPSYSLE